MRLRSIGLIGVLALGLLAGPLPAEAQQPRKVPLIGYLFPERFAQEKDSRSGSPTGFWRMSGHPAVQQALRNHYFDSLGLPRLAPSNA